MKRLSIKTILLCSLTVMNTYPMLSRVIKRRRPKGTKIKRCYNPYVKNNVLKQVNGTLKKELEQIKPLIPQSNEQLIGNYEELLNPHNGDIYKDLLYGIIIWDYKDGMVSPQTDWEIIATHRKPYLSEEPDDLAFEFDPIYTKLLYRLLRETARATINLTNSLDQEHTDSILFLLAIKKILIDKIIDEYYKYVDFRNVFCEFSFHFVYDKENPSLGKKVAQEAFIRDSLPLSYIIGLLMHRASIEPFSKIVNKETGFIDPRRQDIPDKSEEFIRGCCEYRARSILNQPL